MNIAIRTVSLGVLMGCRSVTINWPESAESGSDTGASPCSGKTSHPGDLVRIYPSALDDIQCVQVVAGDLVVIVASDQAVLLPELREVHGDLRVAAPTGAVELGALEEVLGSLEVSTTGEIALDALSSVGGDLLLSKEAPLPVLQNVGGGLAIANWASVSAPVLTAVAELDLSYARAETVSLPVLGSAFAVRSAENHIVELALPALGAVSRLELSSATLGTLTLPALQSADEVVVRAPLQDLSMGALAHVNGDLFLGGTALADLVGLSALTLVKGDLVLSENRQLESLAGLGQLVAVEGDAWVDCAQALDAAEINALEQKVQGELVLTECE